MNAITKEKFSVGCLALTHGFIDFSSSLVVYNAMRIHGINPAGAVALIITYDLLAFALQPLAGLCVDLTKSAKTVMLTGIVLTLIGVILMKQNAVAGIVAVGIGNAFFHIGAGAQILVRYQKSTSEIGIFVGPGALGLSLGIWYGTHGFFPFWSLVIALAVASLVIAFLSGFTKHSLSLSENTCQSRSQPLIVLLLFFAVMIRGFAGRTGFLGLSSDAMVIIGLGAAGCIGKMAGGVIADRFGWGRTTIVALVFASIGILFVHQHIAIAFVTMVLFQLTMPITLVATSVALPGKPAFAFGLTCLALVIGSLATYYLPQQFTQLPVTLIMIGVSGACIIVALRALGYWGIVYQPQFRGDLDYTKSKNDTYVNENSLETLNPD